MFDDLIPSAPAPMPAPPLGLFDDLIPAGAAGGRMFAVPERTDGLASPRSTAGTDPGDERIGASGRNSQFAAPLSGQPSARNYTSPSPGLFDDLIPAGGVSRAPAGNLPVGPGSAEVPSGFAAAVTDIPREIGATTGEAWENLRRALPSSLGGKRDMASEGPLESLGRTGQGLLAAAALPFTPLQGAVRSLVGHPMVEVDQGLRRGAVGLYGEDKVRDAELATDQTPGGMTYDEARRRADPLLHLIPPRGGTAVLRPPVQPNPPGPAPKTGPRGFPPPPTPSAPGKQPIEPDETTFSRESVNQRDSEPSESQAPSSERSPEGLLPVPVAARLTGDELGPATDLRDLRALAKEYARQSLRGRIIVNRETGQPIEINWAGLKKAFSGTRGSDLLRILPGLPNMLEHGRYIGAMADQKMRRGIRAVHVFESAAELTGKRLDTILFVRETNDGRFFYDYGIKRGDTGMPGPGR